MGFIFQPGTRTLPTQRLEPPAATLGPSLADRAALCTTALEALTLGDHTRLDQLFTDDLWFRSPHVSVRSRVELIRAVGQPESTLRDIDISLEPCAITESALAAEWRIDARLTEPLLLGDNLLIEPTADRLHLFGATFAAFSQNRISAFRCYFDDSEMFDGLAGVLHPLRFAARWYGSPSTGQAP